MILTAIVIYFLIGIGLAVLGPLKEELGELFMDARRLRGATLACKMRESMGMGNEKAPVIKVVAFILISSIAIILLWPAFLTEKLKNRFKRKIIS